MIKENISNKENQSQRFHQQKPARKILNKINKSTLNQSPIRKRVEKNAQRNLEALSSYQTLCDNDQFIDLFQQRKRKINFSQQEIVGWDETKEGVLKPKKLVTDQGVQTISSQDKTRKSLTMQTQRIKTMPKLVENRQKTSKTPLKTTKITNPLIEYPTMQKLKLIFDNKMAKSGMKQIIICDRVISSNGCLNGITLNNCATKVMQHKKPHSYSVSNKIQKVDIIKDLSFF